MTPPSRPALGRGLSSLIPATTSGAGTDTVDIDLIVPNPHQPRSRFDAASLQELADSIREHGVLQPVIVTQVRSDYGPVTYQLIAGERRVQAARMAGVSRMPVVIREAADAALLELALVENLQREDLNPLEEAAAFRRLADEFSLTQEQISKRVARSRTAVANTLRLLSLEDDIRASLASGQISEGHARALLGIDDSRLRLDAWRRIVADALTVRQAEEIARALKATSGSTARAVATKPVRRVDPHVRAIEDDLRTTLGAPVSVARGRRGGRIVIRFHSDEELEGIIERIRR
ncbi:MAG: ParB/RepB/Spo0J family partition protein [Dehalococcoidia bacterium]|nr:MAG: ParB/RepB/Spo0J family partition protein [Dehalococcoidia bacterium]